MNIYLKHECMTWESRTTWFVGCKSIKITDRVAREADYIELPECTALSYSFSHTFPKRNIPCLMRRFEAIQQPQRQCVQLYRESYAYQITV